MNDRTQFIKDGLKKLNVPLPWTFRPMPDKFELEICFALRVHNWLTERVVQNKLADISPMTFQRRFDKNIFVPSLNFSEGCSYGFDWYQVDIGLGSCMEPIKWEYISPNNIDTFMTDIWLHI